MFVKSLWLWTDKLYWTITNRTWKAHLHNDIFISCEWYNNNENYYQIAYDYSQYKSKVCNRLPKNNASFSSRATRFIFFCCMHVDKSLFSFFERFFQKSNKLIRQARSFNTTQVYTNASYAHENVLRYDQWWFKYQTVNIGVLMSVWPHLCSVEVIMVSTTAAVVHLSSIVISLHFAVRTCSAERSLREHKLLAYNWKECILSSFCFTKINVW